VSALLALRVLIGAVVAAGLTASAPAGSVAAESHPPVVVVARVDRDQAAPGDELRFTNVIENRGAQTVVIDVVDDVGRIPGDVTWASSGASRDGGRIVWSRVVVPPGRAVTAALTMRLSLTGWPAGDSIVRNAVTVGDSNCTGTDRSPECATETRVVAVPGLDVGFGVANGEEGPYRSRVAAESADDLWYEIRATNVGNVGLTGLRLLGDVFANAGERCPRLPALLPPGTTYHCRLSSAADTGGTREAGFATDQTAAIEAAVVVEVGPAASATALPTPTGSRPSPTRPAASPPAGSATPDATATPEVSLLPITPAGCEDAFCGQTPSLAVTALLFLVAGAGVLVLLLIVRRTTLAGSSATTHRRNG
jgi:hypothetical protein